MQSTATSLRRVAQIGELRAALDKARQDGARIGLVPTMGALHRGHLSLVEHARREAEVVVMSIFVNPLQFGPSEDFNKYPRPIEKDERLAADAGVDLLFTPSAEDMYGDRRIVTVSAGDVGRRWEGEVRPGHFDGVLTVVAKLFNLVEPHVAVFGRKDLQQAVLIQAMVRDLDFRVRMIVAPTIREDSGLALSSRNSYLGESERRDALALNQALRAASAAFDDGETDARRLERIGGEVLDSVPAVRPDYFAVVNPTTMERETIAARASAVIVAARVGPTRLIVNLILGENDHD